MPLMNHRTLALAKALTNDALDGDEVSINRGRAVEIIKEYFKDKIVVIWGPGDIESVADDMDLTLADDEIEEIVTEVQNDHDASRGISWPNLESVVEKYLEYTEEQERTNAPDFWLVLIDETMGWDEDFRKKHQIKRISSVYLVDKNQVTHLCEAAPSYCLYYVDYVAEHEEEDEQISDECDMEIMSQHQESVTYMHVSNFDKARYEQKFWRPEPLTTDMYKDDDAYQEMVNQLLEDYHANPVW